MSSSSNLLVEKIYSIVALRTFVLASVSNELLPKRRVLIKTGSQINVFYSAQESTSFNNIRGTVKKKVRS